MRQYLFVFFLIFFAVFFRKKINKAYVISYILIRRFINSYFSEKNLPPVDENKKETEQFDSDDEDLPPSPHDKKDY
tara:strand:- start:2354 stop:2581 length:228 start_codon:yes stop_codon:yes gene_type:complete